ncbi:MAG: transposase, partial [Deltaproteobacteria bacterium]|nr:transposase [Deltaproteobacteria bacterium]
EPADLRAGFDGLSALVSKRLGRDPLSGHLFLFVNRIRRGPAEGARAARGGGLRKGLRHRAVVRPGLRDHQRADGAAHPGGAGADRDPRHRQQDPGCELARRLAAQGLAARSQHLQRLAQLPGLLLLLGLSRPERGVQHDVLPESGARPGGRRGALRERPGAVRGARRALRRDRVERRAARAALPAAAGRRAAQRGARLHLLVPPPARLPLAVQGGRSCRLTARAWSRSGSCSGSPMRCRASPAS